MQMVLLMNVKDIVEYKLEKTKNSCMFVGLNTTFYASKIIKIHSPFE